MKCFKQVHLILKERGFADEPRVPTEYLRSLFGENVDEALITMQYEMEKKQEGKESRLMDILIAKEWKSLWIWVCMTKVLIEHQKNHYKII